MTRIPSAIQSYWLNSAPATSERLINLYTESLPSEGRSKAIVRNTPGLVHAFTIGSGPIYVMNSDFSGRLYACSGTDAWRMRPANESAPERLGYIGSGIIPAEVNIPNAGWPTIAVGTDGVVFCAPPSAFYIGHNDDASNLKQIDFSSSPSQAGVTSVAYIDGYFVYTSLDGTLFFCSNLLEPTSFNGLYYAKADARGERVGRVYEHNGELWFFSARAVVPWYDAGSADFPFQPREGVSIPYTCELHTIAQLHGSMYWLTTDGVVVRASGYEITVISTPFVSEYLKISGGIAYCDAFTYTDGGHDFYCLNVSSPSSGEYAATTLVYDLTTGLWHERQTVSGFVYLGFSAASWANGWLIGDRNIGYLYYLDQGTSTENGSVITRTMTCPPLFAEGGRAFMANLQLEVEMGAATYGVATVTLNVSDDGGFTYRNRQPLGDNKILNSPGDRTGRVKWPRMGSFRQRVLQFIFMDRIAIYGADADISKDAK